MLSETVRRPPTRNPGRVAHPSYWVPHSSRSHRDGWGFLTPAIVPPVGRAPHISPLRWGFKPCPRPRCPLSQGSEAPRPHTSRGISAKLLMPALRSSAPLGPRIASHTPASTRPQVVADCPWLVALGIMSGAGQQSSGRSAVW